MALSVYTPTGIVHETSVDFTKRVLAEPVHLVQYDASLPVLGVVVFDAGQYITLTASDTVSIRMDKGDGTFIYNPALGMSADGHTVYVQITEQMTVNYGRFEPVLELLRGNGYGCSSPVPLFIDKNPVPNSAIESTDEFQTIAQMYGTVMEFSDALDYLNTPEAQEDVANAEENATAAAQSASAAAQSAENAAAAVDAVEFTQAETRANINSGESLSTIMGKVKKWFADLKNAAFHTVANNYTTTAEGYVLDARLGPAIKSHMDLVDTINSKLTTRQTWTPELYDYNTYLRKLDGATGVWVDLGYLKIAWWAQGGDGPDLSGINTMLQIRGLPFVTVIGGGIYIGHLPGAGAELVIQQSSGISSIYPKPNVTSSQLQNSPSKAGFTSFWCIGF